MTTPGDSRVTGESREIAGSREAAESRRPTDRDRQDRIVHPDLSFEKSVPGRVALRLPEPDVPVRPVAELLPARLRRGSPCPWPEMGRLDVVRHFTLLSTRNVGIDNAFYPLGSCTMKHNPRINEAIAADEGFRGLHPLQDDGDMQGTLEIMHETARVLAELSGMHEVSLHPAAGAHGELTSLLILRAAMRKRGEPDDRRVVLIPDTAHGTNPASCTIAGFTTRVVKSNARGLTDMDDLRAHLGPDVAAFMITNPNTVGLFEENIARITALVHEAGGYTYMDGANFNAIMGVTRPGDFGIDVMHFNLHKTFSTPHGGGGPGCGPVGVSRDLAPFLPIPVVRREGEKYLLDEDRPDSIGRTHGFMGNVGVVVRAWAYIHSLGHGGLLRVAPHAVAAANYIRALVKERYPLFFDTPCLHEVVLNTREFPVDAVDVCKRLIDAGFHPPTVHFPFHHALMIEPTETESRETLERFAAALNHIADTRDDAQAFENAPCTTPVTRPDEARATKRPVLRWTPDR